MIKRSTIRENRRLVELSVLTGTGTKPADRVKPRQMAETAKIGPAGLETAFIFCRRAANSNTGMVWYGVLINIITFNSNSWVWV